MLGTGIDVVDTAAFAAQLDDPASAFAQRTFTPMERRRTADGAGDPAVRLAARFAAKEAFVKAWSSARRGRPPALLELDLREIEVGDDGFGRPRLRLHGAVAEALRSLAREHGAEDLRTHLSLSHDGPVATALVLLELDVPR